MKKITLMMLLLLLGTASYAQVNLSNGLIAYFPFNNNLNDGSGNGHTAFEEGLPTTFSMDRFGTVSSAADFSNGGIVKAGCQSLTSDVTMVFWVLSTNYTGENKVIQYTGFQSVLPNANTELKFKFDVQASNPLRRAEVYMKTGDFVNYIPCDDIAQAAAFGTSYKDTAWHMVLIEKDDAKISLYIDAVFIDSMSHADTCGAANRVFLDTLHMGSWAAPNPTDFYGMLDDIMVYNRLLNAAEKDSLYNLTSPFPSIIAVTNIENQLKIELYPNPANLSTQLILPSSDAYQIQVSDLMGRQIYSLQSQNTKNLEINTAAWPAGVYLLQVRDERGGISVQKLVKE